MRAEMSRELLQSIKTIKKGKVVWTLTYFNFSLEQIETVYVEDTGIQFNIKGAKDEIKPGLTDLLTE